MPFEHGHKKLGGRRKGVPNRVTTEAREFARSLIEDLDYRTNFRQRFVNGDAGSMESLVWQYAYGRPTESAPLDELTALPELKTLLDHIWAQRNSTPGPAPDSSDGSGTRIPRTPVQ